MWWMFFSPFSWDDWQADPHLQPYPTSGHYQGAHRDHLWSCRSVSTFADFTSVTQHFFHHSTNFSQSNGYNKPFVIRLLTLCWTKDLMCFKSGGYIVGCKVSITGWRVWTASHVEVCAQNIWNSLDSSVVFSIPPSSPSWVLAVCVLTSISFFADKRAGSSFPLPIALQRTSDVSSRVSMNICASICKIYGEK